MVFVLISSKSVKVICGFRERSFGNMLIQPLSLLCHKLRSTFRKVWIRTPLNVGYTILIKLCLLPILNFTKWIILINLLVNFCVLYLKFLRDVLNWSNNSLPCLLLGAEPRTLSIHTVRSDLKKTWKQLCLTYTWWMDDQEWKLNTKDVIYSINYYFIYESLYRGYYQREKQSKFIYLYSMKSRSHFSFCMFSIRLFLFWHEWKLKIQKYNCIHNRSTHL
jgi:hypothetical protein